MKSILFIIEQKDDKNKSKPKLFQNEETPRFDKSFVFQPKDINLEDIMYERER